MSPAAERLEFRVSGILTHLRRRTAVAVGAWVAVGVALLWLVAWIAAGGEGWRQGSNVPALLDTAIALWVVAGIALYRMGTRRWFGEVPLSRSIERAAGLRAGTVRGSLELARGVPDGVSTTLATRAVLRTVMDLEGRDEGDLAGELATRVGVWTRRGSGVVALLAVLLTALALLQPARTARAWQGVASPLSMMVDPVLPPLVVRPGDIEVLRGTDVRIDIEAAGRFEIGLAWQAAGDIARTQLLPVEDGRATHTFASVGATIEYRARAEAGSETGVYRIVPIDPLFVSDLVLSVVYPPHTGLTPDEYRGDPPPLRLPAGTTLSFEGLATRPLSSVELLDTTGASMVRFQVEATSFRGLWRPGRDGRFAWSFRDGSGAPAEIQPAPIDIVMVPDSAPAVAIPLPGRDTILPLNLRQPLILDARDDYGLRRVELVAYRVTQFGERHEPVVQGVDLGGTRAVLARPLLDVAAWGLLPGDTVRYFARAVDNGPTGQTGVSREYVLRMPDASELRREAEGALEGVAEKLEELAAEAARQAEENREAALEAEARRQDAARTGERSDFEERENLQAALDKQTALSSEVDSLRAELQALERMLEEAGQADPALREALNELQDLLQELNSEDLQQRMEQLAEALRQEDLDRAEQSLEQLAAEQEGFRQRLEESLERFKRAAVEQDFRATTSEAEELARQEQALADAMREEDDPELRASQQQELVERAERLETTMERLQERLRELGEEDAAQGVEQATERSATSREQMQQAQEEARRGENRRAADRAQEASEQMQQAAQQLEEAQEAMADEQLAQQAEALRQTADDALALARRQSELRDRMQGASPEQMAEMRGDEASLLRGLQNMAENLQASSEGAMGANQEVSAQMGRAMEAMQGTLDALENRRDVTPSPSAQAEQVVGSLNQLALMAIAGSTGQPGEGQGGDEVSDQLRQLAQEQGELMNQSGQIMPMQLGDQAMAQQMQQLSQGQESVASDLGDLSSEPGAADALGDLRELADEAASLSELLAQGRLTPEVIQRQERLFHRLLDAGRSLEREEFDEERESERPGAFERGDVVALTGEQLGAMPYQIPDAEQLQGLSPAVRQLVLEYFERLNRARGGGGR